MLNMTSQVRPYMRPGSAGVWDRRSLVERRKEGFDRLYLCFSFLFFLLMINLARLESSLKTGRGGSGEIFYWVGCSNTFLRGFFWYSFSMVFESNVYNE